jgi:peroxiredoxin
VLIEALLFILMKSLTGKFFTFYSVSIWKLETLGEVLGPSENKVMKKPQYTTYTLNEATVSLLKEQQVFGFCDGKLQSLSELQKGTVILNFILGSWCPMCMNHITRIVEVFYSLEKCDWNMVIVTTERIKPFQDSLERLAHKKDLPGMERVQFISNASRQLLNSFDLRIPMFGFAKPATIMVEELKTAKVISEGVPNEERINCEVSYWLRRAY